MSGIQLAGSTFYPSKISAQEYRSGRVLTSANGTETVMARTSDGSTVIYKQEFTLTWERVTWSVVAAVRTASRLLGPWTYTDEQGVAWTVQTRLEDFSWETGRIDTNGVPRYNATLKFREV